MAIRPRTTGLRTATLLAGRLAPELAGLTEAARGRTMHLLAGEPGPQAAGERDWDTVVSAGWLAGRPDLPGAVGLLGGLLAPGGRLLLLEPTRGVGWRALAAFALAGIGGAAAEHLDRDVAGAVWASGLRIPDLRHLELPGEPPSLRYWLCAEACFPPTAPLAAAGVASPPQEAP
jgi:hypothetical protein